MKTYQEIADGIRTLLKNSAIKEETQKAKMVEQAFIFGMMFENTAWSTNGYLQILMMSGRSILDEHPKTPHENSP